MLVCAECACAIVAQSLYFRIAQLLQQTLLVRLAVSEVVQAYGGFAACGSRSSAALALCLDLEPLSLS
jgi:hypothetical protein